VSCQCEVYQCCPECDPAAHERQLERERQRQQKQEYVLGFAFCRDLVLLIRKNKPEWQAGRLNGLGGAIEPGETEQEAMSREFCEESGVRIRAQHWRKFLTMEFPDCVIHCFVTWLSETEYHNIRSATAEEVQWVNQHHSILRTPACLSNLRWLIPMATNFEYFEKPGRIVYD
jgi:8-oxo-dGTP diphosphatase